VFTRSIWSDVVSLVEGFLGIAAKSGTSLAALEACELLSRHIAAYLGIMMLMRKEDCPQKISDDQVLYRGSVNMAGQVSGSPVFLIGIME